ncbi:R3H domain containing protein encore isoform X3 [Rhodnius prolixus]|uniref:R3H domain containing protein encore isoform X3 n=2 Tax=Rhodnius prolixus TaxID=13249 RepID=UPI003D18953C
MAKLEIPSIVVQNGTKAMERTVRTQRSLSKQEGIHEENDLEAYEENSQCASEVPNSKSSEDQSSLPLNNNTLHRSRSQNKVKLLVRSHAVREETSPPPDPHQDQCNLSLSTSSEQLPQPPQQQSTSNRRHKLRREGSSSETWEHPSLSRGNSREQQYDGSNQVDLHQFIVDTLNRNHKDRMLLLKIENDLVSLAKDPKRTVHKFAQMSSYQRMLVHRVAAYFSMEHNVDTSGVSVIVNTTKATRIPETRFRDFVRDDLLLPEEPRRSILKRDSSSFDETGSFKSGERMLNGDSRRSKSFEEREEEYEKGEGDMVDCLDELHWETEDGVCTQCEHPVRERNPRLLKVESYESGETLKANSLRLSVSKSHSFSGYDPPQQTRILTKQDSGSSMSSRISPSSSGYKSQRSDATLSATPSPTATPNLHTQLSGQSGGALSPEPETVVWAVSDLASVPPGSMLIHPQTGQPYTNADGSIYHYDPSNPPRVCGSGESVGAQVAHHVSSATNNIPSSALPTQQQQPPPQQQPPQQQQQPQPQHQQKHDMMENHVPVSASSQPLHAEISKGVIDSGYESGGGSGNGGGYLGGSAAAPPSAQVTQQALCHPLPAPAASHQYHQQAPIVHPASEPPHPPPPPPQYHPVVYPLPATPGPPPHPPYHHQYDPRIQDGGVAANDLSNYMMGLNIDNTRQPDTRQIMYWQPHHIQAHSGMPVYYAGSNGSSTGPNAMGSNGVSRYQGAPPPPPPQQSCPPPAQPFIPPPAPPAPVIPQQPPHLTSSEHSGSCYSSGYPSTGPPECIPYSPSAVHMYYTPPYNGNQSNGSSQNGAVNGSSPGYYGANITNCSAPILALQYQQPCPHPTPPHTPQGVCGQFAVYNSCYPSHYAQATSSLPVPQLFRKPTLNVGVRCGSPLRPQYSVSPTVKDRPSDEKIQPVPVYGFRVLPGDVRILGNTGRIPFALPAPTKAPHTRKHRSKIGASQGRSGGQQSIEVPSLHTASKA